MIRQQYQQLTKALVERALDGELTHHLGYEKHDASGDNSGNSRNGTTPKTLRGKRGQVQIDVPRDRASEFEPQLVKKHQTRFDGLDENIISLYARGMTRARDSGAPGRDLRRGDFTESDLHSHRCGA
jgi:putative transposase